MKDDALQGRAAKGFVYVLLVLFNTVLFSTGYNKHANRKAHDTVWLIEYMHNG